MERQLFMIVITALMFFPLALLGMLIFLVHRKNRACRPYAQAGKDTEIKCPKCNIPMTQGFSLAGKGIMFRKKSDKPPGFFIKPSLLLENTLNMSWAVRENLSWHCRGCKIVAIDHSTFFGK